MGRTRIRRALVRLKAIEMGAAGTGRGGAERGGLGDRKRYKVAERGASRTGASFCGCSSRFAPTARAIFMEPKSPGAFAGAKCDDGHDERFSMPANETVGGKTV